MVEPLKFTVSYGRTVSTGKKYEFARIDVSEEFIVGETPRAVAYDRVKHFVLKRIEDEKL